MGDRVEGGTGPQTADTAIMASINCVTFNHANYIRTALDSFLMQKTDFAFEILVHDDASTDGTSSIIPGICGQVSGPGEAVNSDRKPVFTGN